MTIQALSDYIFASKYASYIPDLRRRQTAYEAKRAMMDMHRHRYAESPEVMPLIAEAEGAVQAGHVLGSQRALQYGGKPILKKHARLYNCCSSYCDRPEFFREAFWLLLCGCGVGFSVQKHHVDKLPEIYEPQSSRLSFQIPDTIEGWADALDALMVSYFIPGSPTVEFDYSAIRPEGAPLSSGAGKAPGPEPLRRALEHVREVMDRALEEKQSKLRTIDAYDIVMHASNAVLSGGVRRSATIALFSADDVDMRMAKTGDWYANNPQRARSNNSALLLRGAPNADAHYESLVTSSRQWGDPGVVWTDDLEMLTNPCQPAVAPVLTPEGLRTFADIDAGSKIWSETGWTTVTKKWCTGVKPVYRYRTTAGSFIGTENHRVVQGGTKIEVGQAESIDVLAGVFNGGITDPVDVMDGLVVGDGTVHQAGGGLFLIMGDGDQCYLDSEITHLITQQGYGGEEKYLRVKGTVTADEVPYTYQRRVPKRFMFADPNRVRGFLRGLYSANGSVVRHRVTLKTTSPGLRDDVQLMLSSLGIRSYFTTNKPSHVEFQNGIYECRESYDVNVSVDVGLFQTMIGFVHPDKTESLSRVVDERVGMRLRPAKTTYDIIDVEYLGDEEVFDITVDNEPHTYWTGGLNVSNCVEIGLYGYDRDGQSGWQFCNLTEINAAAFQKADDFRYAARMAARIGTLQAGYTTFDYLTEATRRITEEEALIGVSMTGMAEAERFCFDPGLLEECAAIVVAENRRMAAMIGINPAARTTCVKPAGTSSCLLGTSSGIHPHHAHRYFRRVIANRTENPAAFFAEHNPMAVDRSVWSENGEDLCLTFCIDVPETATVKEDLDSIEMLERVKLVKQHWVDAGKDPSLCRQPWLSHNVSNTINVADDEWEDVTNYIYTNREHFAGVALLGRRGDIDVPQTPFTKVFTRNHLHDIYGVTAIREGLQLIDAAPFDGDLWKAVDTAEGCRAGFGEMDLATKLHKANGHGDHIRAMYRWVTDFLEYALELHGDVIEAGRCLKHIHNMVLWERIVSTSKRVDYTEMVEDQDNTDHRGSAVACAGGACEVL